MLLLFAVVAIVSAAVLLISYRLWRDNGSTKELDFDNSSPREFRSLFEEDFKAFELEEKAKATLEIEKKQEQAIADRLAAVERSQSNWASTPNLQNTIEFLSIAALHGKADVFSAAAEAIITRFRQNGIDCISAGELAELLESHFRLLPAAERSSGELFLFKQNVAELASEAN